MAGGAGRRRQWARASSAARWRASSRGAVRRFACSRRARFGAGATQASAGILAPYIEAHERGLLFDLGAAIARPVRRLRRRRLRRVRTRRRIPPLRDARGRADASAASRLRASATRRRSAAVARAVGMRAAGRRALAASIEGAVLAPGHGYVAVPPLMDALAWAALRDTASRSRPPIESRASGLRRAACTIHTEDGTSWSADSCRDCRGQLGGAAAHRRSGRGGGATCTRSAPAASLAGGAARAHRLGTRLLRCAMAQQYRAGGRDGRGRGIRRADDRRGCAGSAGRGL